jgi:hypothetical protein
MNIPLIALYISITVSTGILFLMIIRYLKEKPFGRQFVSDHLSIGLLSSVYASIVFMASAIIAREMAGQFSVAASWSVIAIQQFLHLVVIMSLLSIQVAQFCNIFFMSR